MVSGFPKFILVFSTDTVLSEFNYQKDHNDECVLVPGTTPLANDDSCSNGEEYWYDRTPYRIIPYSTCEDGLRPDRGAQHVCPGFKSKGGWFWFFMLILPFGFTALVGYYYWKRSGLARGYVLHLIFPNRSRANIAIQHHPPTRRHQTVAVCFAGLWHAGDARLSAVVHHRRGRYRVRVGCFAPTRPRCPKRISTCADRRRRPDSQV